MAPPWTYRRHLRRRRGCSRGHATPPISPRSTQPISRSLPGAHFGDGAAVDARRNTPKPRVAQRISMVSGVRRCKCLAPEICRACANGPAQTGLPSDRHQRSGDGAQELERTCPRNHRRPATRIRPMASGQLMSAAQYRPLIVAYRNGRRFASKSWVRLSTAWRTIRRILFLQSPRQSTRRGAGKSSASLGPIPLK